MFSHPQTSHELPPGHVATPVWLTGGMGLLLAAGFHFFGLLDLLNQSLSDLFAEQNLISSNPAIAPEALWLATAVMAFGLAWAILQMPGNWRRITIWIGTQGVILGWVPVAAMGKTSAPVAALWVACAWSGLCSIIYASRHLMPVDVMSENHSLQPSDVENPDGLD